MANTWSAISRLRIDEIEKIQRGFQEYDFDFKISNWATRITCFTCSTFLLLTESLYRIFYKIEKLKKKLCESAYSQIIRTIHKGCIVLLQFDFFPKVVWFARYEAQTFKMIFFCLKWSNSAKKSHKEFTKNGTWILRDKLFSNSRDNQVKSGNWIKKFNSLVVMWHFNFLITNLI